MRIQRINKEKLIKKNRGKLSTGIPPTDNFWFIRITPFPQHENCNISAYIASPDAEEPNLVQDYKNEAFVVSYIDLLLEWLDKEFDGNLPYKLTKESIFGRKYWDGLYKIDSNMERTHPYRFDTRIDDLERAICETFMHNSFAYTKHSNLSNDGHEYIFHHVNETLE